MLNRYGKHFTDDLLSRNRDMLKALEHIDLPDEPSGFLDKFKAWARSEISISQPLQLDSPRNLYAVHTGLLSEWLGEWAEKGKELLPVTVALAKSVGKAQDLLGSIKGAGRQRRSWSWIFDHFKDHLARSEAQEPMEALGDS